MSRRITTALAASTAVLLLFAGCGGDGFDDNTSANADGELTNDTSQTLTVLIGSSSDAETEAVEQAVADWSEQTGQSAEVVVASDLTQQLSQGFASDDPADVFYLAPELTAGFAENGSLLAYGDYIDNKDEFYDNLLQTFTIDGELYAAPKDVSTLQLFINDDLWEAAGLTEEDYPTTWDELEEICAELTTDDVVGLTFSGEYARIGAFMRQAGGGLVSDDGTEAIANSDESIEGLQEVKDLLATGTVATAADLGTGWGGEAFGLGYAVMAIEGNWLTGSMETDYPDVNYTVVELPEGPSGKGTMHFTNGWGIAADSPNQQGAVDLVNYLVSDDVVMDFADAFGIMPATTTLSETWSEAYPELSAFMAGLEYSVTVPTANGASDVITDFNAKLESLSTSDVQTILDDVQTNFEAIL